MEHETLHPVAQICETIGRQKIADAVGVSLPAVSNAVGDKRFPARWYPVVRDLCIQNDLDCPESLFNFASPAGAVEGAA